MVAIRCWREAYVEARKAEYQSFPQGTKTKGLERDFRNQRGKLVEKGCIGKDKVFVWLTADAESAENAGYMKDHGRSGTDGPL